MKIEDDKIKNTDEENEGEESHRNTKNKIEDLNPNLVPSSGRETKIDEITTDSKPNNNLIKKDD